MKIDSNDDNYNYFVTFFVKIFIIKNINFKLLCKIFYV